MHISFVCLRNTIVSCIQDTPFSFPYQQLLNKSCGTKSSDFSMTRRLKLLGNQPKQK